MSTSYEAIIVGGGHNGLVAAAYLAKGGLKVLVLEGRSDLGGAAATEEVFPGYQVSTGAHDAGLFWPHIVRDLGLTKHGLVFLESEVAVFAPRPDGPPLTLWRDSDRSATEIARQSPADADQYPRFLDQIQRLVKALRSVMILTPPDLGQFAPLALMPWLKVALGLRRMGDKDMMEFFRVLPLTVQEFLDEWFEDPHLKGVLGAPAIAGGLPGPQAAGTTFMLLYQHLGLANGGFQSSRFVKGGTGALSAALAAAARGWGAEIRTAAPVAQIRLDPLHERAVGVTLADGEEIAAPRVISSLDPRRTFFELVGGAALEPDFMRRIANVRLNGMTAKVNLALDGLPQFEGAAGEHSLSGHILISPSLDYLERAYDDAKYGRISEHPFLDAVIPTLLDPDLAPAGRHLMSITMQYAPYHLREGNWTDSGPALGDRVVQTLAQFAPDLPDRIIARQVLTPLDWQETYGLTEGSIHHGQMGLDQLLIMRPVPGFARYRTPFANLYLCGASTHPGGGVTGFPGHNAAREVLSDR